MEREPEDSEHSRWVGYLDALDTLHLPIVKSNLLARLIYGGEELRAEPCPEHKGHWSGCVWENLPCGCVVGANVTGWLPSRPISIQDVREAFAPLPEPEFEPRKGGS